VAGSADIVAGRGLTHRRQVAGFVAFLVLFAIPTFGVVAPSIPACVVTTFAAVQESHLIRTGHN
jgi:hypothetical protein